ncbi:MAG TPA: hypothetical protein DC060_16285, partial [Gemmatimonadetes bacterium]|nr:hypothetical protein [Gemmatimonadota bacterium]
QSDASADCIHEAEVGAAHQFATLAGHFVETGGTREVPWHTVSGLVHEPEDIAGDQVAGFACL